MKTFICLLIGMIPLLGRAADSSFFGNKPQVGSISSTDNFIIVQGTGGSAPTRLVPANLVAFQHYVANISLWNGANASRTLTANLSGASDPVLTFSDNLVSLNTPFNATDLSVGGIPLTPSGFTTNLYMTNFVVANPYSFSDVTNKIVRALPGQWVLIPPGPAMLHIPTNNISLMRGVNIECWPTLVVGCSNDFVSRPIFTDTGVGPTTNFFIFHSDLVISNNGDNILKPIDIRTNGTFLSLRHDGKYHFAPTTQARPLVYMEAGTFVCRGWKWDNNTYDGIWTEGNDVRYWVELQEADVNDTLVEQGGGANAEITTGYGYFRVVKGTKKSPGTAAQAAFLNLRGKSAFYADNLNCGRGTVYIGGTASTNVSVFSVKRFENNPTGGGGMMQVQGYSRIENTTIYGGNQNPIIIETPNSVWADCVIYAGSGATNSFEGFFPDVAAAARLTVVGTLTIDKPPDDQIALQGKVVSISGPWTNSYAGTNVFVSLNSFSDQVLIATNSMLLIWTNSPEIASGKEVTLSIFNNKATNMNIAHSTAGVRFLGGVSNTIAAGKQLVFKASVIGTNISIQSSEETAGGGGGLITSVSANQFDATGGNLSFKNGGIITNLAVQANVGFSSSITMNTSEATDKLTINGNTNGTAALSMTTGGTFATFFPGGGSLWDSPHTNTSTMYLNAVQMTGTGAGYVKVDGSTSGSVEFRAPASGQTNLLIFNGTDVAVGQGWRVSSVTTAGGTNVITMVNVPVANTTNIYEFALSDETTDITTGTAKLTWRAPHAMTIIDVRASLSTASSSGNPTVDINEGGTTILSTKLSIDASEKTSTTAATAAVISDSAIADDAEVTFDIDTAGTGARGLKVKIYYTR